MAKRIKPLAKGTALLEVLQTELPEWHGARIKFVALFVLAAIKVGNVTLQKIAGAFDSSATVSSNLKRMERFLGGFTIDYAVIARLLVRLIGLDKQEKWVLTLDRTDWKFGCFAINILMLGVAYKGVAIPLFWMLLDKKGNSSQAERIQLLKQFLEVFGVERIGCLVADREFVGKQWFSFLIQQKITFIMRLKENFYVDRNGQSRQLKVVFRQLQVNQQQCCRKPFSLKGNRVFLTAVRLEKEWLFLASPTYCAQACDYYKERWQIETLFKALKTQGFNLENTHLKDPDKLAKLLALLAIAFVWCYKAGIWLHEQKPIRILKKSGEQLYSFFRYGFDYIQHLLLNSLKTKELTTIFTLLSRY